MGEQKSSGSSQKPFHLFPELEEVMENLITFCGRCHLLIGYLNWWKAYNPFVEDDSKKWKEKIENRKT